MNPYMSPYEILQPFILLEIALFMLVQSTVTVANTDNIHFSYMSIFY